MPGRPRPLAVGLLEVPVQATQRERAKARIALALQAEDEGFALVETYEIGGNGVAEEVAFEALENLAARLDPRAIVVSGQVNSERLHDVTTRMHLTLIRAA